MKYATFATFEGARASIIENSRTVSEWDVTPLLARRLSDTAPNPNQHRDQADVAAVVRQRLLQKHDDDQLHHPRPMAKCLRKLKEIHELVQPLVGEQLQVSTAQRVRPMCRRGRDGT